MITRTSSLTALALASVLGLAGCGSGKDRYICAKIMEPPTPEDINGSMAVQQSASWQKQRAEACVHRQAYRLASSNDSAEIVAKAAVEACEPGIDIAARLAAREEREQDPVGLRLAGDPSLGTRINDIKAAYERFALLKVVEGRAGGCPWRDDLTRS